MLKGVDISEFNIIDYNSLKSDFAIIRAGYGKYDYQKDKKFETHYSNLHDKMPIGAYWYSYAMSEDDARAEAKVCISVLKGKKYELPVYYDVEEASMYNLGRAKVSNIIRAFCTELETAGYWVGVYCSSSWYNAVLDMDVRKKYAIWVAEWDTNKPGIESNYGVWQYKVGTCVGAQGQIDLDYMYINYPTLIKNAGLNGYPKTKINILESTGLKHGDRNDYVYAYKCLLRLAYSKQLTKIYVDDNNVFGDGTLKATNEILTKLGYVPNGIAGPKLMQLITRRIQRTP